MASRLAIEKRENGIALRGIATVCIMLSHILGPISKMFSFFFQGTLWVWVFFFYSGYGLSYSKKNNPDYLNGFLTQKVKSIYAPFFIAEIAYEVVIEIQFGALNLKNMIAAGLGINLSNSVLWYVLEILIIYFIFYLVSIIQERYSLCDLLVWPALYAAFLLVSVIFDVGTWWYISTSAFVFGICFNHISPLIRKVLSNRKLEVVSCMIAVAILAQLQVLLYTNLFEWVSLKNYLVVAFYIIAVPANFILSAISLEYIKICNPVTIFLGSISYHIYLIHMIVYETILQILDAGLSFMSGFITVLVTIAVSSMLYWAKNIFQTFIAQGSK